MASKYGGYEIGMIQNMSSQCGEDDNPSGDLVVSRHLNENPGCQMVFM